MTLSKSPYISDSLVFGRARLQTGVLIKPVAEHEFDIKDNKRFDTYLNLIWYVNDSGFLCNGAFVHRILAFSIPIQGRCHERQYVVASTFSDIQRGSHYHLPSSRKKVLSIDAHYLIDDPGNGFREAI
jgi:hypothetical protein